MDLGQLLAIIIGAIFVSNFVLARFLGLCPFVGVSKDSDSALGMGMAVIFVMTMASLVTWFVYVYVLVPLEHHVPPHHRVHPGHRHARSVRRDGHREDLADAAQVARHLSAAHHDQLRRAGRCGGQRGRAS